MYMYVLSKCVTMMSLGSFFSVICCPVQRDKHNRRVMMLRIGKN